MIGYEYWRFGAHNKNEDVLFMDAQFLLRPVHQ